MLEWIRGYVRGCGLDDVLEYVLGCVLERVSALQGLIITYHNHSHHTSFSVC